MGGRDHRTPAGFVEIGRYSDEAGHEFSLVIDHRFPHAIADRLWDGRPAFGAGELNDGTLVRHCTGLFEEKRRDGAMAVQTMTSARNRSGATRAADVTQREKSRART